MKHKTIHFVNPEGDIVFQQQTIYKPDEFLRLMSESYKYASDMAPGYFKKHTGLIGKD